MTAIADVEAITARIWQSSFDTDWTSDLEVALREQALVGVRPVLEQAVLEELEAELGFAPYVRSAKWLQASRTAASGYFRREVVTAYGRLADVRVPKLRRGNKQRTWQILTRYQSPVQGVLDRAVYADPMGLSLRDVQELLYRFVGHILSRTAVKRITRALQATMTTRRSRPAAATPPCCS